MKDANGTYVKVYIYWEMMSQKGYSSMDLKKTAEALNLSIEDVEMARDYWKERGILQDDTSSDYLFENSEDFEDIKTSGNSPNNELSDYKLDKDVDFLLEANKIPEFKHMFESADNILQKETSPNEKIKLLNFITDYAMNPDVVLEAVRIGAENGKKNFDYIEGIIRNWNAEGITTIEGLNEYLETNRKEDEKIKEIRKAMNRTGKFTEPEELIIKKWFDEYGFDMEIIREGLSRLISTNNPSVKYLDGIFTDWHNKNFKTLEDIRTKDKRQKKNKSSQSNKFNEFEQRDNEDIDDDYYNQQRIKKMLEGKDD